ncbi:uncharacterized protein LOC143922844 [Arctopsyche grandis]|uniref:uncharacterized protein LOC143922844 n=1 Tax=Arctopsyche grandis TaxID=121162 RepID=UPI00406D6EFE
MSADSLASGRSPARFINTPIQESPPQVTQPIQLQSQPLQEIPLQPLNREQILAPLNEQSFLTVPISSAITIQSVQALPSSSEIGIIISSNQAQMQDQLQKKHEELKHMIRLQQEELRRVSEQLVMARYGLLPPIINVAVPLSGVVQANNTIEWNESPEIFPVRPVHHPSVSQQVVVDQQNHHQMPEHSNFIPMQMSQHQAQLLFSSTDGSQNVERPG